MMYQLDFIHSDYNGSCYYLKSPSGAVLWIHPDHDRGQMRKFVDELNETLKRLQ
jgi:hypothetical protein